MGSGIVTDKSRVERDIQREIELARQTEDGTWITYLIRDPRRPDLRGSLSGWPMYVGQTDEFGRRVRNHLRKSEKLARKGNGVKYRLKELLHAGVVPNFEVLDRKPTRLQSLLSETNFARLCRSRGYDIANQTTLQNEAGPPVGLKDLPTKWFWRFTPEQAALDALEIELVCRSCGETVRISPSTFSNLPEPPKELREIRENQALVNSPCTFCGSEGRRIALRLTSV